jgi:integrase
MTAIERDYTYVPEMNPKYWAVIRDFVVAAVDRVHTSISYPTPVISRNVADFTLWCWSHAGLPLDDEVFDRATIGHYIATGCPQLTPAARGNRRSLLLRVSEALGVAKVNRLRPLPPSDPTAPYRHAELVSVISWARGQSTPDRRRNGHILLALGLGAGLSAQEIIELRRKDVTRDEQGTTISVPGPRPRVVPVLREWEDALDGPGQDDDFVFRSGRTMAYTNAISNFVARGPRHGIRPQSQRMRTTWLIRQLDAGTPVAVLAEVAGVDSLEAFTRYMKFTARVPRVDAMRLVREA